MRRYNFLEKADVHMALNRVRDAFLAAKDGEDVEQIINGVTTFDERMKIGRRILIAQYLLNGTRIEDIQIELKVGRSTIAYVSRNIDDYEKCFSLISKRSDNVEKEYKKKSYKETGGSSLVFKKKTYTGFKRKNVRR